jgi:hypothetical protein
LKPLLLNVSTFLAPSTSSDFSGQIISLPSDPSENINLVFLSYLTAVISPSCASRFHLSLPYVVYSFMLPFDVPMMIPVLILIADETS